MNQYNSSGATSYLHTHLQDELDDYNDENHWVLMRTEMDNGSTWYDFVHPTWGIASVQEVGTGFSCETEADTLLAHRDHASSAWTTDCQKVVEAVRALKEKTQGAVLYQSLNSVTQSPLVANIEHALWAQTQIHFPNDVATLEDTPEEPLVFELNSTHPYGQEIVDILIARTTGSSHSLGHKQLVVLNDGSTMRDILTSFVAKGAQWNTNQCASANQSSSQTTLDLSFFTEATAPYNSNKEANSYDATVFLNGLHNYQGNLNVLFTALEGFQQWPWLAKAVVKKINPIIDMNYLNQEYDMEMNTSPEVSFELDWPVESCARWSRIFDAAGEDAQLFKCEAGSISPHPTYPGTIEDWAEQLEQYGFSCGYDSEYDEDEDDEDEDDEIHGSTAYGDQVLMTEAIKNDKYTAITRLLNKNATEVSEGLKNGSFLVNAILSSNIDAIAAFMDANATVNDKVVAALIQKMQKFEAFVQPILEKSQSVELLTACVNWQMGLNPTGVNPRQRDWIFNSWKNHPNKDSILVEAATHSDSAWRVVPWKTELQTLATTSPQLFFKSINNAVQNKKYNFVRETVRALKIQPSQIIIGSSNLLTFSQNLKASIKGGGKISAYGHPSHISAHDILNNPSIFGMGQRPSVRQVDPTESFVQAITIMEAQFAPKKSNIKRGP